MRVAISGASGLVGAALMPVLTSAGHEVRPMVRPGGRRPPGLIAWDPEAGSLDLEALKGVDAVVHLAGESIASRWTDERKRRIRDSRVKGTRLVAESLARLATRPSVLVCASAVGVYGPRGAEPLDETAAAGTGFLAEICRAWEAARLRIPRAPPGRPHPFRRDPVGKGRRPREDAHSLQAGRGR
jgi:hypothetical protein